MAEPFLLGDIVDVTGLRGVVRYVGETQFAEGEWVGVELDTPSGKNNGIVKDVQYFSCREKYGMFVRASVPRLMERPAQPIRAPVPRAPSALQKRMSVPSPSPTPGQARGRGLTLKDASGAAKPPSPTKGVRSGQATPNSAGPSTPRTSTPTLTKGPALRPGTRPSTMAPPPKPTAPTRTSTTASATSSAPSRKPSISTTPRTGSVTPSSSSNRLSLKPSASASANLAAARRPSSERTSPVGTPPPSGRARTETLSETRSVPARRGERRDSTLAPGSAASSTSTSPRGTRASTSSSAAELATAQREAEDLKSKIKILEKKRMEDREKLATLQRIQEERDKYESIIQKLQTKYQPLQHENVELKKKIKDIEVAVTGMEAAKAEDEMMLEMAALDKEMAEEQAEAYKAELEVVRGKVEEYEMELEILREENEELSQGMSPEEKTSAGWLQLEKQNDRLKEALLKLRDYTSQTEGELKAAIKSLEEENMELQTFKDEFEAMQDQLKQSESAVEDLRQQLETALGAEEMLEELTERNMNMGEQLDELRATVEDLESLKEIADELEINHVESEKQMQEELDYRDSVITEHIKRIIQLEQLNEEAEYTIKRFRDVVRDLQNDLEDMKASSQITETEAQDLTARTRAMMDVNMKLQMSAAKTQNKTIDLELRRLDAEEAIEHLNIVQLFLPDSFEADRDSIQALLRFRRVSFKAHLLQTFVKERIADTSRPSTDESILAACEVCDKLTWVSAMCERFISCMESCSVQHFNRFQGALLELDPVERALNQWIEGLRKDELKEKQCAAELQRTMALMNHLGEIHLIDDLEGFASDVNMKTMLMQSYMESSAAALTHIRVAVSARLPPIPTESGMEDPEDPATNFLKKADNVISHCRSSKVLVSKILRSIDDFRQRGLSLTPSHMDQFVIASAATAKLAEYTRALGVDVYAVLQEDLEDPEIKPTWSAVQSAMIATTERVLQFSETDFFSALAKELKSLTHTLMELASTAADIDATAEFERSPAPWILRAQELKQTKTVDVDLASELRRLKDDIIDRATQIVLRDQTIEEQALKIQLLESRMKKVSEQASRITHLESDLAAGKIREKEFEDTIESLNEEINSLEAEITKLKTTAATRIAQPASVAASAAGDAKLLATTAMVDAQTLRDLDAMKRELVALRNTLRYIRAENLELRHNDVIRPDSWLTAPLTPPPSPPPSAILEREAEDLMSEFRDMVLDSKVIEVPAERAGLKWRPERETPRWRKERERERFQEVEEWKRSLVERVKAPKGLRSEVGKGKEMARVVMKRRGREWLGMGVPGEEGKGVEGEGREVRIGTVEGWEGFLGSLGVEDVL